MRPMSGRSRRRWAQVAIEAPVVSVPKLLIIEVPTLRVPSLIAAAVQGHRYNFRLSISAFILEN